MASLMLLGVVIMVASVALRHSTLNDQLREDLLGGFMVGFLLFCVALGTHVGYIPKQSPKKQVNSPHIHLFQR